MAHSNYNNLTQQVVGKYFDVLIQDQTMSTPVAAISALIELIRGSRALTLAELSREIDAARSGLQQATESTVGVMAGCELLIRFVMRIADEYPDLVAFPFFSHFQNLRTSWSKEGRALCKGRMNSGRRFQISPLISSKTGRC